MEVPCIQDNYCFKRRSGVLHTTYGVPQGSVLGPFLFIIFMNDLTRVNENVIMYADDTSFTVTGKADALEERVAADIGRLAEWFRASRLSLNASKTYCMKFGFGGGVSGLALSPSVGGELLLFETSIKFLGVTFQENLRWVHHCEDILKKISSQCYLIRNLKYILNKSQLRSIYFAHVESRLSYGILVWGSSPMLHDVFIAQKRVLRCLASVSPLESCRPLFHEYGILTVPCLYIRELLVFTFKRKHTLSLVGMEHNYNTRTNVYMLPHPRLELYRKSPFYLGIQLYNLLPQTFREIGCYRKFKREISRCLRENSFYSLDEYVAFFR